jgi:hypothetical protein
MPGSHYFLPQEVYFPSFSISVDREVNRPSWFATLRVLSEQRIEKFVSSAEIRCPDAFGHPQGRPYDGTFNARPSPHRHKAEHPLSATSKATAPSTGT